MKIDAFPVSLEDDREDGTGEITYMIVTAVAVFKTDPDNLLRLLIIDENGSDASREEKLKGDSIPLIERLIDKTRKRQFGIDQSTIGAFKPLVEMAIHTIMTASTQQRQKKDSGNE